MFTFSSDEYLGPRVKKQSRIEDKETAINLFSIKNHDQDSVHEDTNVLILLGNRQRLPILWYKNNYFAGDQKFLSRHIPGNLTRNIIVWNFKMAESLYFPQGVQFELFDSMKINGAKFFVYLWQFLWRDLQSKSFGS